MEPKPLVKVGGEALIDRLLRVFMHNDATSIVVICNERMTAVADHLRRLQAEGLDGVALPLNVVVKSTPSSMHSLYEMRRWLKGGMFCLTTVDTIFSEKEFEGYITALKDVTASGEADGVMGVTPYIDDEKPLYVATDGQMRITAFSDHSDGSRYVSAGIYGLGVQAVGVLEQCVERGESRMRNFQRALLTAGVRLKAHSLGTVFDIDHATDIDKAHSFVAETNVNGVAAE